MEPESSTAHSSSTLPLQDRPGPTLCEADHIVLFWRKVFKDQEAFFREAPGNFSSGRS